MRHPGEDGEQTGGRAPAAGDVGRRGPAVGDQAARGHVPLVHIGQFGRGRAGDVPRAVDRPRRQHQVELQLGHYGGPVFAYPAAVLRHGHRHHRRHHDVLDVAVSAVNEPEQKKIITSGTGTGEETKMCFSDPGFVVRGISGKKKKN